VRAGAARARTKAPPAPVTIAVCKSSAASKYSRVRTPAACTSDAVAGLKCRRAEFGTSADEDSLQKHTQEAGERAAQEKA